MWSWSFREMWGGISGYLRDDLEQAEASAQAKWTKQHSPAGAHTDVTADSVDAGELTAGPSALGPTVFSGDVAPDTADLYNLGTADLAWNRLHARQLSNTDGGTASSITLGGIGGVDVTLGGVDTLVIDSGSVQVNGALLPVTTATWALGSTTKRWSEAWVTAGAFNSSDARLKKNVTPVSLGLDFINDLRPVEYDWINPSLTGHHYGFLAQDVLPLGFAGVDTSNPNEYAIRYTDLIAPLVKAVQELSAEVQRLRAAQES
jgi:hypothetical protein